MPPIRTGDTSDAEDDACFFINKAPRKSHTVYTTRTRTPVSDLTSCSDDDESIECGEIQIITKLPRRKPGIGRRLLPSRKSEPCYAIKPAKPRHETVIISGIELRPTVAFDTLWRFAAERKAIDDKRRAGMAAPWTNDSILRKYFFCNTYRVLDKVCQYLICEVIEKGSQDIVEVVFRVTLFNMFTKIETWELLTNELGPLTWATYNRKKYQAVLGRAKRFGTTLYTGSFIKPAPKFEYKDNFTNHLCLLEVLMENELPLKLASATYMADIFEYLVSFPSMGDFTTYQLMLNLSYTDVINFHPDDFVVPGLGASSGLTKLFGKANMARGRAAVKTFEIDVIRWLVETQDYHFNRLGLQLTGLGPNHLPMNVADMEHTICEVDKYCRLSHPEFKGRRTEIRRNFIPSTMDYPAYPSLPKAWAHPARKVPRIRPEKKLLVEKRYTISHVGNHRAGMTGIEYHVFWYGYSDDEATWEPEISLKADAPMAIKEYWKTFCENPVT